MLLTLTASSLRSMLARGKTGKPKLDLLDLPTFTRQELSLHGLNLSTDLLAGVSREGLERLRERADKAGCACLLLVETEAQAFGGLDAAATEAAVARVSKVVQAGHYLGCNAVAVRLAGKADDAEAFARTAQHLRKAVDRAEKLEMNVLISPGPGVATTPEKVTDLIKKVGGFRVGTYPDFEAAATSADPIGYLRRLTPYASAVCAATQKIEEGKGGLTHGPYDLGPLVEAILSVGYDGTLAIEYRGSGDAKVGVERSRMVLERLLGEEGPEPVEEDEA
ncbi:MAG: sugar phosphate isomerase/epimerase family protein [Phycisphaerales bacterium]